MRENTLTRLGSERSPVRARCDHRPYGYLRFRPGAGSLGHQMPPYRRLAAEFEGRAGEVSAR
jgi:hypothetical protein